MNELIPTIQGQLAGELQPLVNARDLHAIMDVGKDFSTWIKERIETYGFIEGVEFSPRTGKTSSLFGGRPKTEYHLTLDMAKELALLEVNAKGQKVRRYFIDMEKLARQEIPAFLRRPDLPMPGQVEALQIERLKAALLKSNPEWGKIVRYKKMGLRHTEISKLVSLSPKMLRLRVRLMEDAGMLTPPKNLDKMREQAKRIRLAAPKGGLL